MKNEIEKKADALPVSVIKAQLHGDYKGLSEEDRVKAALGLCRVLGISAPLNPFRFIDMNGKTVLYAPNEAAQLIAEAKKASVVITNKFLDKEQNIYFVEVRVSTPTRAVDNIGTMFVGGLTGKARADAIMKCVTKAQRRSVFSAFGLSVTDDDDLEYRQKQAATPFMPPQAPSLAPPPQESQDEAEELKITLFQQLIGKGGRFEKKPAPAKAWILDNCGKEFDKLTADDANDLLGKLENEAEIDEEERLNRDLPPPPVTA